MRTDITQVISSYVNLRKRGHTQVGLCPFHNEKTPSFTVYEDTQSFYCFGCGAGGDAITFIRKIENLDYMESVKLLADRAGLTVPTDGYDDSMAKKRRRILEANREAARFYHSCLVGPSGKEALEYFLNRGLTMRTIQHFGLGYAPNQWDALLTHMKKKGFHEEELVDANLARRGERSCYDNFRHRVMTPIIDLRQNVIAFGGRVLDDSKPKYINTADTLVYKKTHEVFALNFAKNEGSETLILCEGYMDVISMHQAGFTNAIACCGTALTSEQARLIARYTREVVLAYDADGAGQKAVDKAISMFSQTELKVRIPSLVGGKDPDEILRKFGPEKMKGMLEGAANDTEFQLLKEREKCNLQTSDGKISFLKNAAQILSKLSSPIEVDVYAGRLAEEFSVSKASVLDQIKALRGKRAKKENSAAFRTLTGKAAGLQNRLNPETSQNLRLAKAQERLISLIMYNPDFYGQIEENLPNEAMASTFYQKVYRVLMERLRENRSIDLTVLSAFFTPEEMGELAKIQAMPPNLSNPQGELEDCIRVLKEEMNKKAQALDPAKASEEEFRDFFKRQQKKKT